MSLINVEKNTFIKFVSFTNLMKEYKQKLIDLGFAPGEKIKVLSGLKEGFITVFIKGSRVAIDAKSASMILVKEVI